jgi:type I restriction-modification system DNA methylase subunit
MRHADFVVCEMMRLFATGLRKRCPKFQYHPMSDFKDVEKALWTAADKMRSNMDAAEYKHVVLGLLFLKYISDAFSDLNALLHAGEGEYEGAVEKFISQ